MRHPISALLLLTTAPAFAANYATCILDKMPGVANDVAAQAVYNSCLEKYPEDVKQGSGRGFFGYASSTECIADKARDTRSAKAAQFIGFACRKLYDEYPAGLRPFTGKLDGE